MTCHVLVESAWASSWLLANAVMIKVRMCFFASSRSDIFRFALFHWCPHLTWLSLLIWCSQAHWHARLDRSRAERSVSLRREAAALALALCSLLLGLFPWEIYLSLPVGSASNSLALKTLSKVLWPILGGAVLAIVIGRWGHRPVRGPFGTILVAMVGSARRPALIFGKMIELVDCLLQQWSVATLSLLVVAIIFGVAMLAGR